MDAGEMPREALGREVTEETGLRVEVGDLLDIYALAGSGGDKSGIVLAFAASLSAESPDTPVAADDVLDAMWWPVHDLPAGVAFESTRRLLDQWMAQQNGGGAPGGSALREKERNE